MEVIVNQKNSSDKVKVFLSHKREDASAAEQMKKILKKYSGQLDIFIDKEISPGDKWLEVIKNELNDSQVFLLLFTDPTKNWDWCLYEAGLYTNLEEGDWKKVVCIFNPEKKPPRPLKNYQAVAATLEDLTDFLKKFYRTEEITGASPPLNKDLDESDIKEAAKAILDSIKIGDIKTYYNQNQIICEIPEKCDFEGCKIPSNAIIQGTRRSLEMFEWGFGNRTWGDLEKRAVELENESWFRELENATSIAMNRDTVPSIKNLFNVKKGERDHHFRSTLYRTDWKRDRPVKFFIIFTEETQDAEVSKDYQRTIQWSEYWLLLDQVAKRLENKTSEYKPDVIMGLSNGGMAFGDFLIHKAYKKEWGASPVPITSIWIDRSGGKRDFENEFNEAIILGLRKFMESKENFELLLVDDYVSTGGTIEDAIAYLKNIIPKASIKFLPLFSYETSDALIRNREHFLWLNNPFKDSFDAEEDTYTIHETQKIKLPYGKDMMRGL